MPPIDADLPQYDKDVIIRTDDTRLHDVTLSQAVSELPLEHFDDITKIKIQNDNSRYNFNDIIREQNKITPKSIECLSAPNELNDKPELNVETLRQLFKKSLLNDNLEIRGFKISGTLNLPSDINIKFVDCVFEEKGTINFNGQQLGIINCEIKNGIILHSNDPTAKISIENTTFPDKNNPSGDNKLEPLKDAAKRAFIIDGAAEALEIKKCTGLIILSNLTLEDKNNAPAKVKFLDDKGEEISNLSAITEKFRVIIPRRNLNEDITKEFLKNKRTKELEKFDKKISRLENIREGLEKEYIHTLKSHQKQNEHESEQGVFSRFLRQVKDFLKKDEQIEDDPLITKAQELEKLYNEIKILEAQKECLLNQDAPISFNIPSYKFNYHKEGNEYRISYEILKAWEDQKQEVKYSIGITEEEKDLIKSQINSRTRTFIDFEYIINEKDCVVKACKENESLTKVTINTILKDLKLSGEDPSNLTFNFIGFDISDELKKYLEETLKLSLKTQEPIKQNSDEPIISESLEETIKKLQNKFHGIVLNKDNDTIEIVLDKGTTELPLEILEELKKYTEC